MSGLPDWMEEEQSPSAPAKTQTDAGLPHWMEEESPVHMSAAPQKSAPAPVAPAPEMSGWKAVGLKVRNVLSSGHADEDGANLQGWLQRAADVAPKGSLDWAGIETRYPQSEHPVRDALVAPGIQRALGMQKGPTVSEQVEKQALQENRDEEAQGVKQHRWKSAATGLGTGLALAALGNKAGLPGLAAGALQSFTQAHGDSESNTLVGQAADTVGGGVLGTALTYLGGKFPVATGLGLTGAGVATDDPDKILGGLTGTGLGVAGKVFERPAAAHTAAVDEAKGQVRTNILAGDEADARGVDGAVGKYLKESGRDLKNLLTRKGVEKQDAAKEQYSAASDESKSLRAAMLKAAQAKAAKDRAVAGLPDLENVVNGKFAQELQQLDNVGAHLPAIETMTPEAAAMVTPKAREGIQNAQKSWVGRKIPVAEEAADLGALKGRLTSEEQARRAALPESQPFGNSDIDRALAKAGLSKDAFAGLTAEEQAYVAEKMGIPLERLTPPEAPPKYSRAEVLNLLSNPEKMSVAEKAGLLNALADPKTRASLSIEGGEGVPSRSSVVKEWLPKVGQSTEPSGPMDTRVQAAVDAAKPRAWDATKKAVTSPAAVAAGGIGLSGAAGGHYLGGGLLGELGAAGSLLTGGLAAKVAANKALTASLATDPAARAAFHQPLAKIFSVAPDLRTKYAPALSAAAAANDMKSLLKLVGELHLDPRVQALAQEKK